MGRWKDRQTDESDFIGSCRASKRVEFDSWEKYLVLSSKNELTTFSLCTYVRTCKAAHANNNISEIE